MVSPWMASGNIMDYVKENRGANRLELVRSMHRWFDSELTRTHTVDWGRPRPRLPTQQ